MQMKNGKSRRQLKFILDVIDVGDNSLEQVSVLTDISKDFDIDGCTIRTVRRTTRCYGKCIIYHVFIICHYFFVSLVQFDMYQMTRV